MDSQLSFEARLADALREYANRAPVEVDPISLAATVTHRPVRSWWPALSRRAFWRAAATVLVVLALVAGLIVGSGLLRERSLRPLSSNGLVAVAANQWGFGGHNGDIYVLSEGNQPRRIIGAAGDAVAQECPRFSPDGQRLAFGEARATGAVAAPATGPRADGSGPVDHRAIVVVGLNDHGDVTQPLTRVALPTGSGPMVCPEWSPNGRSVAFRVDAELWIADAATGATRVVPITSVSGQEENELEWSRDGSKIAVAEPRSIRIVDVVGGTSTLIPVDGDVPRSLGWTAGDDRIVYISVVPVDEVGMAIRAVGVNRTNDTLLSPTRPAAPGLSYSFNQGAISPDGTKVAYLQGSSQCTGDSCGPGPELKPMAIADLDGSNRVEMSLPTAPALPKGPDGSDFAVSDLQWSPDGKRLLLSSIDGVISVGIESSSPAVIYEDAGWPSGPSPSDNGASFGTGLYLEWSWSEATWQPVLK
jgi:Tol biopolymer transport system component